MAWDGFDSIELIYDKYGLERKLFKKPSNVYRTIEQLHIYSCIAQDNVYTCTRNNTSLSMTMRRYYLILCQ